MRRIISDNVEVIIKRKFNYEYEFSVYINDQHLLDLWDETPYKENCEEFFDKFAKLFNEYAIQLDESFKLDELVAFTDHKNFAFSA